MAAGVMTPGFIVGLLVRAGPSGFRQVGGHPPMGCATFARLTSLHPGL